MKCKYCNKEIVIGREMYVVGTNGLKAHLACAYRAEQAQDSKRPPAAEIAKKCNELLDQMRYCPICGADFYDVRSVEIEDDTDAETTITLRICKKCYTTMTKAGEWAE